MRHIHYIEIENFKCFGERQRIEFGETTVLMGPNNCGKTTVLHALMLWLYGVQSIVRFAAKANGRGPGSPSVPTLRREDCQAIPGESVWSFFTGLSIMPSSNEQQLPIRLSVGYVSENGSPEHVTLVYRIISNADELSVEIVESAGKTVSETLRPLSFAFAHPMSAMDSMEAYLNPIRRRALAQQGMSGSILRNLALSTYENSLDPNGYVRPDSPWEKVNTTMGRLFRISLSTPKQDPSSGLLDLCTFPSNQKAALMDPGVRRDADGSTLIPWREIETQGRGCLQMLYLLLTIFSDDVDLVLIDEPDAHLEILRQKQVLLVLQEFARENGVQLILTSHSEAVFDDSLSSRIVLLADGRVLSSPENNQVRGALEFHGGQHYLKARVAGHVLYLEQYTDLNILMAIAKKLGHPLYDAFTGSTPPNVYYTRDDDRSEPDLEEALEKMEGGVGVHAHQHFKRLAPLIPGLQGIFLCDRNDKKPKERLAGPLQTRVWKRYEIESYFVSPAGLLSYAVSRGTDVSIARKAMNAYLRQTVFSDPILYGLYEESDPEKQTALWLTASQSEKASRWADQFFRHLEKETGKLILTKPRLYELIPEAELFDIEELTEKLDAIHRLLVENRIEARMLGTRNNHEARPASG